MGHEEKAKTDHIEIRKRGGWKSASKKWNELGEKAELQRGHSGVEPAKGLR
jgi:hypothetical protein